MIFERFRAAHVGDMDLRAEQRAAMRWCDSDRLAALEAGGPGFTARTDGGRIVGCAGLMDTGNGSILWAFVARDAEAHSLTIARGARRLLEVARKPVTASTAEWFPTGRRFLEWLGLAPVCSAAELGDEFQDQIVYRTRPCNP